MPKLIEINSKVDANREATYLYIKARKYEINDKVYKLELYAELSGDTIQRITLKEGEPCTDLKIIILKASNIGEFVKDVGIRLSERKFAVYREKGEIYV